jgi:hypothetical protein
MSSDKVVLIMGAGTVGNRSADVLLSLGIPVVLCKYDAAQDEIKSQELKALLERYASSEVGKRLTTYAARGRNVEERAKNLEKYVGRCGGSIDDLDFETVELVIDATDGLEVRNHAEIYRPHKLPFAINGGGDTTLVKGFYFASVPNSRVAERWKEYRDRDAEIVSCNTHCVTTALAMLSGMYESPEEMRSRVRDIDVMFARRHDDPHKGKKPPQFVTMTPKRYHIDEVEYLLPASRGMIETTVSKWPTEYFHNVVITIDFHEPLSDEFVEELRYQFLIYPRCILVENELSHQKTIDAARWAKIPDGDIPFPVYLIHSVGRYKVRVLALTPQRGIVAPSTADYVLLRSGRVPQAQRWQDVFSFTNANARYRDQSFGHIKNSIQDNLDKFEEKKKQFEAAEKG